MKIGRQIIQEQEHIDIAAEKYSIQEGISEWRGNGDRKIMMCLWFIAHRALSVGTWGNSPNVDPRYSACG